MESLVYNKQGRKVQLAENINSELEKVGFRNLGVKERPNLIILKRSKMPAVLVEAGFLNTAADNELFDERFGAIAEAIADGVLKTLGEDGLLQLEQQEDDTPAEKRYRVQTGAYRNWGRMRRTCSGGSKARTSRPTFCWRMAFTRCR